MNLNHFAVAIWRLDSQHGFERVPVEDGMSLDASGSIEVLGSLPTRVTCVVVRPARAATGEIGVGIVPEGYCGIAALNGAPIRAGLHMLKQGDYLDVGTARYWVSAEMVAEEAIYDPLIHGEDIFCFLTKARLVAGQPITICPGTTTSRCGVIYKADAWDLAMRQSDPPMSCACGYSPSAEEWRPPATKIRKNVNDLFRHLLDTTN